MGDWWNGIIYALHASVKSSILLSPTLCPVQRILHYCTGTGATNTGWKVRLFYGIFKMNEKKEEVKKEEVKEKVEFLEVVKEEVPLCYRRISARELDEELSER